MHPQAEQLTIYLRVQTRIGGDLDLHLPKQEAEMVEQTFSFFPIPMQEDFSAIQ
jgi:hypothetical protein